MTDLSRWNPFRFDRRSQKSREDVRQENVPARREIYADPFSQMRNDMNQMVKALFNDDWLSPALRSFGESPTWFGDFTPRTFAPAIDVVNEKKHLVVTTELPGLDKKDVKLSIDAGVLTISGEKRQEKREEEEGCYRTERFFGQFQRRIPLPSDVDIDHVEAHFDKGVLNVRLPKVASQERTARQIELK